MGFLPGDEFFIIHFVLISFLYSIISNKKTRGGGACSLVLIPAASLRSHYRDSGFQGCPDKIGALSKGTPSGNLIVSIKRLTYWKSQYQRARNKTKANKSKEFSD
jgi:hypothetical protein